MIQTCALAKNETWVLTKLWKGRIATVRHPLRSFGARLTDAFAPFPPKNRPSLYGQTAKEWDGSLCSDPPIQPHSDRHCSMPPPIAHFSTLRRCSEAEQSIKGTSPPSSQSYAASDESPHCDSLAFDSNPVSIYGRSQAHAMES
jgi:hypothetical protein